MRIKESFQILKKKEKYFVFSELSRENMCWARCSKSISRFVFFFFFFLSLPWLDYPPRNPFLLLTIYLNVDLVMKTKKFPIFQSFSSAGKQIGFLLVISIPCHRLPRLILFSFASLFYQMGKDKKKQKHFGCVSACAWHFSVFRCLLEF